jgi:hypothetical protein
VEQAWDYFRNVQTKNRKYTPFITANDPPAIWLKNDARQVSTRDEKVLLTLASLLRNQHS